MEELVIPAAVWSGDIDATVDALLLKVALIEWFDEPDRYILILERPDSCKSLDSLLQDHGGETSCGSRWWQRSSAASKVSCIWDIKLENLLINPDTLAVKLIDFGCGDLIRKSGYNTFKGWFAGTFPLPRTTSLVELCTSETAFLMIHPICHTVVLLKCREEKRSLIQRLSPSNPVTLRSNSLVPKAQPNQEA
ncbi:hypothetical protein AOLI_G00044310 [Acnodon oligacanthus]